MNAKKLIALLLTLVMLVGLLPAIPAQAAEELLLEENVPQDFSEADGLYLVAENGTPSGLNPPPSGETALPEAIPEDVDALGAGDFETYDSPYEDLPEYAQQSQQLNGAQTVVITHHEQLRDYLYRTDQPYHLILGCNLDARGNGDYPVWAPIRGIKSLNLNGHTIYLANDRAVASTMFEIETGAYLEVYDSAGGGWINYDGYIGSDNVAQVRNLFRVFGTMILNGGTLEAGRSKSAWLWNGTYHEKGWKQIRGSAIILSDSSTFIMNGGAVYGRSIYDCGLRMFTSSKAIINAGTIGAFGGGCAFDPNNNPEYLLVNSGRFFGTSSASFANPYQQSQYPASQVIYSQANLDEKSLGKWSTAKYPEYHVTEVVCSRDYTYGERSGQVLKPDHTLLTLRTEDRVFGGMEGVFCNGTLDATFTHSNQLQYTWEVESGRDWLTSSNHTSPTIDVTTAWRDEGFTMETGREYNYRCTVVEKINDLVFTSIYENRVFYYRDLIMPIFALELSDERSFRKGDDVTLRVDATGGEDLCYLWYMRANTAGADWVPYACTEPTLTLGSLWSAWDGYSFRCEVTNSEGGEAVSNTCTLRYVDSSVKQAEFFTEHYAYYNKEAYVPIAGEPLATIFLRDQSITIEKVNWSAYGTEENGGSKDITSAFPGQWVVLELGFRFEPGVTLSTMDAEHFNVTLDGRPFTGWKNMKVDSKGTHCTYYWGFTAVTKEEGDFPIQQVKVSIADTVERGNYSTPVYKRAMGYEVYGDNDVRYRVNFEAWSCDGEGIVTGDMFLGHANYSLVFFLEPEPGWTFTPITTVMLDGEKCDVKLDSDGVLCCQRDYYWTDEDDDDFENHNVEIGGTDKPDNSNGDNITGDEDNTFTFESEESKELISLVTLSGAAPVPFQTCAELSPADIGYSDGASNDKRYSVKSTRWFCEGKEMFADDLSAGHPGNMFVLDRGYEVVSTLTPSTGYKFSAECAAKLGEADMKVTRLYDGDIEVTKSWYIDETGLVLSSSESYAAPNVLHDDIGSGTGYVFGTLTINCDYNSSAPAVVNKEDGLVIYVEKDVTVRVIGGKSAFILNGDTTITGPGRLTVIVDDEGTQTTGPAAIQVNGCKLTIRDADLSVIGCTGIRGSGGASLELDHSNIRTDTVNGGIFDFTGNMTLSDCRVTEPSLHMGSTLGILYPTSGYNPVEDIVVIPERSVQSISIGGLSAVETSLTMRGGETRQLTAIISPADAAMQEVTWSADTNSVKVSPDGLVTAYKVGNATVTASCGGMSASIGVAVISNDVDVESFDLIPHEITVGVGQTAALRPVILPLNASNPSGFWYLYSNDPHVALVGDTSAVDLNEATVVVRGVAPGDADVILFSNGYADGVSCTVHVVENYTPAESVTVTGESNRTLHVGDTATLTATVLPASATDKTVMWTSSDPDVVTVDQSGQITVEGLGKATVTAEIWNGTELVSSSVEISVPYPVLGVGISAPRNVLYVGGSMQLEAYVYPGNAENRAVTWTSSNEAVAMVDSNGVVTAVGTDNESSSGNVTITCTTVDGGFSDSMTITVNQPPRRVESLTLSQNELTMPVGARRRIDVNIAPWNADNTFWDCSISSPLATASIVHLEDVTGESCYVVADIPGTANLTFRSEDGGRTARLRVKVIPVEDYVPVESVTLPETITIGVGQGVSLLPTITPANASERTVLVSKNLTDDCIAVEDGRIIGLSVGSGTVKATVDGIDGFCTVNVVKPVESLTLDEQAVALALGASRKIIATVSPLDAYDKTVTWTSADENIVTVDTDGTLHAVGFGTTYITAETAIFPLSTGCTVTVVNNPYDLIIDGVQVTDENATSYGYDPLTRTLSLSGGLSGSGRTPFIRSGIDGMHIVFTNATLSNSGTILHLEADTTVIGTADLRSVGSAPIYVTDGATLTLDGTGLSVSGPMGIQATGTGETLVVKDTNLSISAMVEAAGGFDGGITLSGCVLLDSCRISDGGIVTASGNIEIVLTPVYGTPDFTLPAMIESVEESAFEGIGAEVVYIPDGCTAIGKWAFKDCTSLTQIRIPAGCAIGEGAFDGCGTVFVYGTAGSPAEAYCSAPANRNCVFVEE